jgi:hypothetical protein
VIKCRCYHAGSFWLHLHLGKYKVSKKFQRLRTKV